MNTYRIYLVLFALMIFSCSKTGSAENTDTTNPNVDADYSVLLTSNGILSESLLNANGVSITKNPSASPFESIALPDISYREQHRISFYTGQPDCSGQLTTVDFSDHAIENFDVFDDLQNCQMQVISITHSDDAVFLVYSIPGSGAKETHYFIRIVDITAAGQFTELELDKAPIQGIHTGNKVFILSRDAEEENKFALVVLDTSTQLLVHDLNLDFDVQRIFKNIDGNIMVSYPELHLVVNSSTMGIVSTVRYNEGKEPKFGYTDTSYLDAAGNLYYPMPTGLSGTAYPNIPGVYDFSTNTAILYFFENFLTESERDFEFEIEDTSMVAYDSNNNLILIGYQKSDNPEKGGLLRIKPIPEPKFIDNIDLDGVPYELFVD